MRKRDPLASVLWRILKAIEAIKKPFARMELRRYDPRLPHTIYILRAVSVVRLLEKYKPKTIVELGSGESTGWFAAYAAKNQGVRVISVDQPNWTFDDRPAPDWWDTSYQEASTAVARSIGGVEFVSAQAIPEGDMGYRYDYDIPVETDFILLDGPFHYTHAAGMDVPRMLKKGHRPKVICVDGRTTGVDVLTTITPDYDFHPQMQWCFERREQGKSGMLKPTLGMNAHSIFVRR